MDAPHSAIIVVNADLTKQVTSVFQSQLALDEILTGTEFDARLAADPNYPTEVRLMSQRILVVRNLQDTFDRTAVDFVVFYKNGLVSVEHSKYGPPGFTLPLARLYLNRLAFEK